LMKKFIFQQSKEAPLQIKSVIVPESAKGFIYIEAFKRTHVKQAVEGINALRPGVYDQQMVPNTEMKDVLRVIKTQAALKEGMWVRMKRGIYKDDLAQVDYVEDSQNQVCVKMVPRIDMQKFRGFRASENKSRSRANARPPQKLFNEDNIRAIGGEFTNDGDFLIFEGARYSRKGYLYKTLKMDLIQIEGVKPTLSELEKFEDDPNRADVDFDPMGNKSGRSHNFAPGDMVIVSEGELAYLEGRIISISGNKITMMPKHEDLKEALEFPANELRKLFKVGDHVKVITGRYEDETGLVVRVEENVVVVFSDTTMHELKVRPEDLQACTEKSSGVDKMGKFKLGDMVQIDAQNVGVIVRLEKEAFQILNQRGKQERFRSATIQRRRDSHNAVALDGDQNPIRRNDKVKVIDGPHVGKDGEVKHLYRGNCFIYNRKHIDSGGMFVARARHLSLAGSNSGAIASNIVPMSPRIAQSPQRNDGGSTPGRGTPGKGPGASAQRSQRDTKMIGQTIRIIKGPYKGHIGIVRDATPNDCQIELHSDCFKHITVKKANLKHVDSRGRGPGGNSTPFGRTPAHGSHTPAYHNSGSRTPAYGASTPRADGSRTPSQWDGGRTPQYDGSRTPRGGENPWNSKVANTPRDDGFGDNFDTPGTPGTPYESRQSDYAPSPQYAPQTPSYDQSSTPYSMNPSPSPGPYSDTITPSPAYGAAGPTPSPGYKPTPSPGGYDASPSPNAFTPMNYSPGMSPMFGQGDGNINNVDWHSEDIEVSIKDSHDDASHRGKTGIIKTISGHVSSVWVPDLDQTVSVGNDNLSPIQPQKNHKVKVLHGDDQGHTGELISIDGNDGIVRMDADQQLKILQLKFLGKIGTAGSS